MRLLSLDLATATGWAIGLNDKNALISGTQHFPGTLGSSLVAFEDWLLAMLTRHAISHIVVEAPIPMRGATTVKTTLRLFGAHAVVRKVSARLGLPLASISVSTWRSFFIGHPRAPKTIPAAKRRAWLKAATISECERRGLSPQSADEADAIGLLIYAILAVGMRDAEIELFEAA